jgi:hypothetical protein
MRFLKQFLKTIRYFLLLSLILDYTVCIGAPKTKVLIPKKANGEISIIVSGKSYKYYPLLTDESLVLTVKGPGKLKVICRGRLETKLENSLDISVNYRIDGGKKIRVDFNHVKSDHKSVFKNTSLGLPSLAENIIIELSRGEHTIEIWSGSKKYKISTRSLFTQIKEKKIDWVSLSPLYPNEPVSLITNENVVSYFRYSSIKILKVKVTGPTVLRVLNRFEFDYRTKGKINFRVEVKEDKKVRNTYMLCSDRSDVTRYNRDGKHIPGKANEIVINVPAGTHIYEINPLDQCSVLARILFPKKDIKLEAY